MADLVKATGVPKSTILYYVSEGLLPEPERPKANVALYDPISIDVVRYVRAAQQIHRYPLSWIRTNLQHILAGVSPDELLRLGARLLGPPQALLDEESAAEPLADAAALRRYVDLGLVYPTDAGQFDAYDVRMAELLERADAVGLPAEAFTGVAEALREVEERSAEIAQKYVDNPLPMSAERAMVLVEVLARLQPYLLHRYLERREAP